MTKIRSHLKHNVFMLDEAGELLEHLGGTEDYLLAAALYEVALKRWPMARIQMRALVSFMTASEVRWCKARLAIHDLPGDRISSAGPASDETSGCYSFTIPTKLTVRLPCQNSPERETCSRRWSLRIRSIISEGLVCELRLGYWWSMTTPQIWKCCGFGSARRDMR